MEQTSHHAPNFTEKAAELEPTAALPGSAEKIRVLELRAAHCLDLWHPEDPVDFGPKQPVRWMVPEVATKEISRFRESRRTNYRGE